MAPDGNEQNKMEVFTAREVRAEQRRAMQGAIRPATMEKPPDLVAWWRIIRKRRWTVLTAFSVLFVTVLVGSIYEKPVYQAKALIEIDKEDPSVANPQELFQLDEVSDAYLETQYKVLASDDLAERVIHQLGLDRQAEFLPSSLASPWRASAAPVSPSVPTTDSAAVPDPLVQETVLTHFQDRLDIRPIRRSRAVELRFDSQDPDLAARAVNAVVENYIQKNFEARWGAAQKASGWLSQQLQDLKAKLEKSQDDLHKYAAENGLLYLVTDKGQEESIVNQSVREIQDELTKAEADRFEKESIFRLIQSGDYASLPGVFDNKLLQDLTVRLADLQREHAQLAATFTEDYPKVKETQSQIAEIQSSLERERWRAAQKISNDYFAALRREKLVRQAFAERQAEANQIAEKSVQYGILSQEVDTNKGLYEGLLERLKEAGVTAGLKAGNIRIVDPATVPYKPIAPNYPLNLGLAAFLGLGLGVSMAFLKEHLDQTIRYSEDVFHFLGVPVLGFIPTFGALNGRKQKGIARADRDLIFGLAGSGTAQGGGLIEDHSRHDLGIHKGSAFSEAFRELRTSVILSASGRFANSILVTSAQPGEGKNHGRREPCIFPGAARQAGSSGRCGYAPSQRSEVFSRKRLTAEQLSGGPGRVATNGVSHGDQPIARSALRPYPGKSLRTSFVGPDAGPDSGIDGDLSLRHPGFAASSEPGRQPHFGKHGRRNDPGRQRRRDAAPGRSICRVTSALRGNQSYRGRSEQPRLLVE